MVARFHSEAEAERARGAFIERFQKGAMPDEMHASEVVLSADQSKGIATANLLATAQYEPGAALVASVSEGHRMVKQGAVRIDGERVSDRRRPIGPGSYVVQVGKRRFSKVTIKAG